MKNSETELNSAELRSSGIFSFGKSRHLILIIKINLLKIPENPTKTITLNEIYRVLVAVFYYLSALKK